MLELVTKALGIGLEDFAFDAAVEPEEIEIGEIEPAHDGTAYWVSTSATAVSDEAGLRLIACEGMPNDAVAFGGCEQSGEVPPVGIHFFTEVQQSGRVTCQSGGPHGGIPHALGIGVSWEAGAVPTGDAGELDAAGERGGLLIADC